MAAGRVPSLGDRALAVLARHLHQSRGAALLPPHLVNDLYLRCMEGATPDLYLPLLRLMAADALCLTRLVVRQGVIDARLLAQIAAFASSGPAGRPLERVAFLRCTFCPSLSLPAGRRPAGSAPPARDRRAAPRSGLARQPAAGQQRIAVEALEFYECDHIPQALLDAFALEGVRSLALVRSSLAAGGGGLAALPLRALTALFYEHNEAVHLAAPPADVLALVRANAASLTHLSLYRSGGVLDGAFWQDLAALALPRVEGAALAALREGRLYGELAALRRSLHPPWVDAEDGTVQLCVAHTPSAKDVRRKSPLPHRSPA